MVFPPTEEQTVETLQRSSEKASQVLHQFTEAASSRISQVRSFFGGMTKRGLVSITDYFSTSPFLSSFAIVLLFFSVVPVATFLGFSIVTTLISLTCAIIGFALFDGTCLLLGGAALSATISVIGLFIGATMAWGYLMYQVMNYLSSGFKWLAKGTGSTVANLMESASAPLEKSAPSVKAIVTGAADYVESLSK